MSTTKLRAKKKTYPTLQETIQKHPPDYPRNTSLTHHRSVQLRGALELQTSQDPPFLIINTHGLAVGVVGAKGTSECRVDARCKIWSAPNLILLPSSVPYRPAQKCKKKRTNRSNCHHRRANNSMYKGNFISHIPNTPTNSRKQKHMKFLPSRVKTIEPRDTLPKRRRALVSS
jgi:hypothetical protein